MKNVVLAGHLAASIAGLAFERRRVGAVDVELGGDPPDGCDPSTCTVGGVTATVSGYGAESTVRASEGRVNDVDTSGLGVTSKDNSTLAGSEQTKTRQPESLDRQLQGSYKSSTTDFDTGGAAYAEVLAIKFSKAVSLTQVAVAWTSTDSDAMIFRWDGAGAVDLATFTGRSQLPSQLPGITQRMDAGVGGAVLRERRRHAELQRAACIRAIGWSARRWARAIRGSKNNDGFKVSTFTGNICVTHRPTASASRPPTPVDRFRNLPAWRLLPPDSWA